MSMEMSNGSTISTQHLKEVEQMCRDLYETDDNDRRQRAQTTLVSLSESPEALDTAKSLLQFSKTPTCLVVAANLIDQRITSQIQPISLHERIQLKTNLQEYLLSSVTAQFTHYVMQQLSSVLAKLCKIGWLDALDDDFPFRSIVKETIWMITHDHTGSHMKLAPFIGMLIFKELVAHFGQPGSIRSLSRHRKLLSSFRDDGLNEIFSTAINYLKEKQAKNDINGIAKDDALYITVGQALNLCSLCLQFDFSGISSDDPSDELTSLQVPPTWKKYFCELDTLRMFFQLYSCLPADIAHFAMCCLNSMSAVRRGILDTYERQDFLKELVQGVCRNLSSKMHLNNSDCYHQFCRLILRLKANYQMLELVKLGEDYKLLLTQLSEFTIQSFYSMGEFSSQSIYYLISFWSKQVSSMPYARSQDVEILKTFTPGIVQAYIKYRLETSADVDACEEIFEDHGTLQHQLDQIATISRCDYNHTCQFVLTCFDHCARNYQSALVNPTTNSNGVSSSEVCEMQLSWLVLISGYMIGARVAYSTVEAHDTLDGELASRILQLSSFMDQNRARMKRTRLDESLLLFLDQLRKNYVIEHIQKNTQLYDVLSSQLNIHDDICLLEIYIQRIITNLKVYKENSTILNKTLNLLNELSTGTSMPKKIIKLEAAKMLAHTSVVDFPFLSYTSESRSHLKLRVSFYKCLSRLMINDIKEEDNDTFIMYVTPFNTVFQQLSTLLQASTTSSLGNEIQVKRIIAGISCDLRGVINTIENKVCFQMFFSWFFPDYMNLLVNCVSKYYNDSDVILPLLKLFEEISTNHSQRLNPGVTSPNGILLFKQLSRVVFCYGTQIINYTDFQPKDIYDRKYKGMMVCFRILKSGLSGQYCNFGVFRLYNDSALDDALQTFIKMLISVPLDQMMAFPRLTVAYFSVLEILCQDHIDFFCQLDQQVILYVLSSVSSGIKSNNTLMCTGCCQTLDYMLSYVYKQANRKTPSSEAVHILNVFQNSKNILQDITSSILNTIMFQDCRNQWSMSRPLLCLILIDFEYFQTFQKRVLELQPMELLLRMSKCFSDLMEGIEQSVSTKNKDKFSQNLNILRRDLNNKLKDIGPIDSAVISD